MGEWLQKKLQERAASRESWVREYSLTVSPSFPSYVYVQLTVDVLSDIQYAQIDERVLCNIILFLFPSSWSSGGRR